MINSKNISIEELNYYIKILNDFNENNSLSYSELSNELLVNFKLKISKEELYQMLDTTIQDDVTDLIIIYKNI